MDIELLSEGDTFVGTISSFFGRNAIRLHNFKMSKCELKPRGGSDLLVVDQEVSECGFPIEVVTNSKRHIFWRSVDKDPFGDWPWAFSYAQ